MQFNSDYYYHVYNRGADKRKIFLDKWDYIRFLESLRAFNQIEPFGGFYQNSFIKDGGLAGRNSYSCSDQQNKPLVKILTYCLNPNHYHLLLKQEAEKGISEFMKRIGNGYTRYFNHKYKHSGFLFQGKYKNKEISSSYDLLKLSVYINCNAEIHGIAKKEEWIWSSYLDYIGKRNGTLCIKDDILEDFKNNKEYIEFCEELISDIKEIKYLQRFED